MDRANLYKTAKNDLVLVLQNPNEGWVNCHFRLLEDNKLRMLNSSHINMTSTYTKVLKQLFPNYSFTQSRTPHRPKAPKYTLSEDMSKAMFAIDYVPYEPKDLDTEALRLETYLNQISAKTFTPESFASDVRPALLGKRDMVGHNPWGSNALNQKALSIYEPPILETDDLYKNKIQSKLFKDIQNFLEVDNPLVPHKNVLMYGPAGTGKTTLAESMARKYNMPFASIVGNARLEAEDMAGNITIQVDDDGDSAWTAQMTAFLEVAQAGGICFIDELLQLQGNTQASANNIVFGTKRHADWQGKKYFIHPKTIFMAATNVGYEGVGHANFAFKDRFRAFKAELLTRKEIVDYYKSVFTSLKVTAIKKYVDLCFDIDSYLEERYKDTDEYNIERPQLTIRRMNDMIGEILVSPDIKEVMHSTLSGIMNSPSFSESDISNVLDYFEKRIDDLDQALFANGPHISEGKKLIASLDNLQKEPPKPKSSASKKTKVDKKNGKVSLNLDDPNAWEEDDDADEVEEDDGYKLDVEDYEDQNESEDVDNPIVEEELKDEDDEIEADFSIAESLLEDME